MRDMKCHIRIVALTAVAAAAAFAGAQPAYAAPTPEDTSARGVALGAIGATRVAMREAVRAERTALRTRRTAGFQARQLRYRNVVIIRRALVLATRPTSAQGTRVRALTLAALATWAEHRLLLARHAAAVRGGQAGRARILGRSLARAATRIGALTAAAARVVLPDAPVPPVAVFGWFATPVLGPHPPSPPDGLTPPGDQIDGCRPSGTALGFYWTPTSVVGTVVATIAWSTPAGPIDSTVTLTPAGAGILWRSALTRAGGLPDGPYRAVVRMSDGRLILDSGVTRACR